MTWEPKNKNSDPRDQDSEKDSIKEIDDEDDDVDGCGDVDHEGLSRDTNHHHHQQQHHNHQQKSGKNVSSFVTHYILFQKLFSKVWNFINKKLL